MYFVYIEYPITVMIAQISNRILLSIYIKKLADVADPCGGSVSVLGLEIDKRFKNECKTKM
jgi:hypothetical protein